MIRTLPSLRTAALSAIALAAATLATALATTTSPRAADLAAPAGKSDDSFLAAIGDDTTVASTIPANGDVNPYAILVAPFSSGVVREGDVLVGNFNNSQNLQGLGTTIVDVRPETHRSVLFAAVPRHLEGCPGGVGFSTAMTLLKSGYVIIGSLPSNDGTTGTSGPGCLLVFDTNGTFVKTLVSDKIDQPWSNMVTIDRGASATIFFTNINAGRHPANGDDGSKQADVVRMELGIGRDGPVIRGATVVASGFQEKPDKDVFVIGPTGLALDRRGTLYVSDANGNSVVAVANALGRKTSAGTGREITKDGLLKRPLAMVMTPTGHLLSLNAQDGRVVEIDPVSGTQVVARWINTNKAQTPPGNGNLFGLALTLDGHGFYYVNDDVNQLALSK